MFGLSVTSRSNSARIVRRIQQRKAELLNQFGVDVREEAVSSMRQVPGDSTAVSRPGSPPFVRSGKPNLTSIEHAVSSNLSSVKVGPVKKQGSTALGRPTPGVLETGGVIVKRSRNVSRRTGRQKVVRYQVAKRPYIRPAAMRALSKMRSQTRRRGIAR